MKHHKKQFRFDKLNEKKATIRDKRRNNPKPFWLTDDDDNPGLPCISTTARPFNRPGTFSRINAENKSGSRRVA